MKTIGILIFMTIHLGIFAQKDPIKWKEIAMEDMEMTQYTRDTSASAIIICDYGRRYFDINSNGRNLFLFNDRHTRIKILKTEGLKYAHVRIPFHDMTCEDFPGENSIVIRGMTYNMNKKGEIEANRLKLKNIKYTDSTNCIKIAEFDLPNVAPGSLIEYKYSIPTLDLISPAGWHFQNDIPTLHSEFRMRVPVQYDYFFAPQNIENFDVSEQTFYSKTLLFPVQYYGGRRRILTFNLSGKEIRLVKNNVDKFEYQDFTDHPQDYTQSLKIQLIRAVKENMDYGWEYLSHALAITTTKDYDSHEPKQRKLIPYPAAYVYYKMPDWAELRSDLLKSEKFGLPLIKHWNHEQILDSIIKEKENPEDRLIAIYDFTLKNMNWNGEYNIYVRPVFNTFLSKIYTKITKKTINEKSLSKPFAKGEGSSSDINFILIYLLNKAGIETHPVIISTRDHGQIDTNIVNARQFNHVVAYAKLGDRQLFLDATDSLRPYQLIDKNFLSPQGFMVKSNKPEWIQVSNGLISESSVNEKLEFDKDLHYQSKIKITENGYFSLEKRKVICSNGREKFLKDLETKYSGLDEIQQSDIINSDEDTLPLVCEQTKSGKARNINEIEIKPNFDPIYSTDNFTDYIRKYPVDFPFPFKRNYELEIGIPEGFIVELPENKSFSTYGGHAKYDYKANQEVGKISISIRVEINLIQFPPEEYYNLAQLFAELNEKIMEPILIKKQ